MNDTLRCRRCGEVIGVYEPMVVLSDGRAWSTSRAARSPDRGPSGECYHQACYAPTDGERGVLE